MGLKFLRVVAFGNKTKVSRVDFGIHLIMSEGVSTEVQEKGNKSILVFLIHERMDTIRSRSLKDWKEKHPKFQKKMELYSFVSSISKGNDRVVVHLTTSLNRNQLIRWDRAPPIDRKQMTRQNSVVPIRRGTRPPTTRQQMERSIRVGGSNPTFADLNESTDLTRPLINQLDVPISSNVDELINIAEEQNDLDLNLRL
ncbi:hypothetical protein FXO38_05661 [Capsicum annuum]|nr:hypothetical protein FXO37_08627 [Capsicum annuum]KAF3673338.1 hypothetical protein FXO38_05661 [Capsicum annuum]